MALTAFGMGVGAGDAFRLSNIVLKRRRKVIVRIERFGFKKKKQYKAACHGWS